MDLSVIIVNYNVKYFLEQCLHSVYRSMEGLRGEIIVIDNNSVDGSCQMIEEKFPVVRLIANKKNAGFSRANNQGIKAAKGKYILLLNPDTVVQEDTFQKCHAFMESHPKAGSLGVKMIDGKGNFLPESKRSLPTPQVSFYKIFGFSALFPRSKIFGRYHLGYLDDDQIHKIEILPGAFMFIRKSVLDEIGLLDETFFMYGEDIDLSYRIILAGYDNYYFPETTIIHYKGESTKKGSINYVMVFYKAMIIFAQKHFSPKYARLYSLLINIAVYLRASFSILRRIFLASVVPLADAVLIYGGFYTLKPIWERYKFGIEGYYPPEYLHYVVPVYILILLIFLYMSGGYEKKTRSVDLIRGISMGAVCLLLIYALLPEGLRYSRALILFGTMWAALVVFITRLTLGNLFNNIGLQLGKKRKRIIIAGSQKEGDRVMSILKQVNIAPLLVGMIGYDDHHMSDKYVGHLGQILDIVKVNRIDEIVFCAKDISSGQIINTMLILGDSSVEFKIAPPESLSVIGSNSINAAGELYVVHFNALSQSITRRKKRLFDVIFSIILLISYPVTIFFMKKKIKFLGNILAVMIGVRSWVGYAETPGNKQSSLPSLKPGIATPVPVFENRNVNKETIERFNLLYAKDYKIMNDISIIFRDFRYLGK